MTQVTEQRLPCLWAQGQVLEKVSGDPAFIGHLTSHWPFFLSGSALRNGCLCLTIALLGSGHLEKIHLPGMETAPALWGQGVGPSGMAALHS